jgi:predicted dienelactone hydrolase
MHPIRVTGLLVAASMAITIAGQTCDSPHKIGYTVLTLQSGLKTAIWYPTGDPEVRFTYAKDQVGMVAHNGPVADCGRLPLVIFSHAFGGCGTQSLFFTEELARHGYIVAAPDHRDALCSVDGRGSFHIANSEQSFFKPENWTPATYIDRKNDLQTVIASLLRNPTFGKFIDPDRIGAAGHSLGGYVIFGMAGGWSSWKDDRIKAALLFSPYLVPFAKRNLIRQIGIPIMYQGAQLDIGITPFLKGPSGVYARSGVPKYYVELHGGNHFEWTNLLCIGQRTVEACLHAKPNARTIDDYGIGFLNEYLKGIPDPVLTRKSSRVAGYMYVTRSSKSSQENDLQLP